MSGNIPIVNQPFLYINGLQVTTADNTNLTIAAGQCRDSTDVNDIIFTTGVNLNAAATGANGIDTGTFAASKTYNVFALGSSLVPSAYASLMSLSTTPLLPSGYDIYRQIGYAFSDGSTHFLLSYQVGNNNFREFWFDTRISVLSGGTQTSFTAIDLSAAVPVVSNTPVYLYYSWTPNAAGNLASLRPTGSSATSVVDLSGVVASQPQVGQVKVVSALASSLPKIDYKVAASGSLSLAVYGFEYFI